MNRRHHVHDDLARGWPMPDSDRVAAMLRVVLKRKADAPRPPRKAPRLHTTRHAH